jgi:hypothetical protein
VKAGLPVCALVMCLLAGCADQPLRPSVLQRLDRMAGQFSSLDRSTQRASRDMSTLNGLMQRDQEASSRAWALRLVRTGATMNRGAERAAAQVQRLSREHPPAGARPYFALLLRALQAEAAEGTWLSRIGALVRADPLVTSPAHVRKLGRMVAAARRAANAAVAAAASARRWRARSGRSLEYAPAH